MKRWTKAEKNVLRKYWDKLKAKDIAKMLNKTEYAIYGMTKKMFPSGRSSKKSAPIQKVPGKIQRVEGVAQCNKCGLTKTVSAFHKHSCSKDGLNGTCKECRKHEYKSNSTGNPTQKPPLVIKTQPFVSSEKRNVPFLSLREMQFITGRIADLLPTQYLHFDKEKRIELHKALKIVYKFCGDLEPERILEFMKGF